MHARSIVPALSSYRRKIAGEKGKEKEKEKEKEGVSVGLVLVLSELCLISQNNPPGSGLKQFSMTKFLYQFAPSTT